MDRMIYLGMAGAKSNMQRQEILSHNLANVSTTGFRAQMMAFRAAPVRGDGATTRVFQQETTLGYDDTQGPITSTGRNLDVAMKGKAWMSVQGLDGNEAYTRAGQLEVSPEGLLVTNQGLQVQSESGPIQVPVNAEVLVADDGTVSARVGAQRPQPVGRIKLVTPEQPLVRGEDGLFRTSTRDPVDPDPNARLQGAALEGSNVNPIETLVAMLSSARQYETQAKLLSTAQSDAQAASRLLSNNA
jgi:flagellar basal-body rod protein FlgF